MVMDSCSFMTIKVSTNGIWSFSYLPWKVLYSWIHTAYLLLCNGSRECVWMCKWQTSECKQRQRSLEWAVSPMKGMWNRVQGQQRSWCSCDNIELCCVCTLARDVPRLPRSTTYRAHKAHRSWEHIWTPPLCSSEQGTHRTLRTWGFHLGILKRSQCRIVCSGSSKCNNYNWNNNKICNKNLYVHVLLL